MTANASRPGLLQLQRSGLRLQSPRRRSVVVLALLLSVLFVVGAPEPAHAWGTAPVTLPPSFAPVVTGGAVTTAGGAAVSGGGGMSFAAGAGGVAAAPYAVAAGVGILIGWGVVESGLWDWATGEDPVPPTTEVVAESSHASFKYEWESNNRQWWSATSKMAGPITVRHNCDGGSNFNMFTGFWQFGSGHPAGTTLGPGSTGCFASQTVAIQTEVGGVTEVAVGLSGPAADRRVRTTADCIAPDNTITAVTAVSDWYAPGERAPTPAVTCPPGTLPGDVSIVREVEGDTGLDEDIFTVDHGTDTYPEVAPEFEPCLDGSCELELVRTQGGSTLPCALADVECAGWTEVAEPTRSDVFQCLWGGNPVPLGDCEMWWEIDTEVQLDNGRVRKLGPKDIDPGVDSDLSTPTDRTTTIDTGTGTPVEPAPEPSGCGSFSWLNPFSGMAQAVGCALEWAFIPDQTSLQTSMATFQAEMESTPPLHIMTAIGGSIDALVAVPTGGTVCSDYVWSFEPPAMYDPGYSNVDVPTFDAEKPVLGIPCEPPFDWSLPYGFMVAVVWIGTLFGLYNLFGVAVRGPRFVHNVDSADLSSLG